MKRIFLVAVVLLPFMCFGQITSFAGTYADCYVGHTLIVKPKDPALQGYGYRDFYKTAKNVDSPKNHFTVSKEKYVISSDYSLLVYRRFKCTSVFRDSTDIGFMQQYYWLKLQNDTLGTAFYRYDAKYDFNFSFELDSVITIPQDKVCANIREKRDKFEGHDRFYTPLDEDVSLMKVKHDSVYRYYLNLTYPVSSPTFNKGVIVLLNDGTKLNYPEAKVETSVSGSSYMIKSFISLKPADVELLKIKEITDAKIYATEIKIKNGWAYKYYMNCLFDKK